jgi:ssDNA-binding Zn-finger/Zn-ribbon topoisomerase 1
MGPDRFTCTKCQLRIWRNFMGYELTATDLHEMLHGQKITSDEKNLVSKKNGPETVFRGRLMFNESYQVRIAPKIKSKEETGEKCPKCGDGRLLRITGIDSNRWYGCSAYPKCRFTKSYVPHLFVSPMLGSPAREPQSDAKSPPATSAQPKKNKTVKAEASTASAEEPVQTGTAAQNDYRRIPPFIRKMLHLREGDLQPNQPVIREIS